MAREKKKEEKGATRFWLLAALVVVVTGGVLYWLGSGDSEAAAAEAADAAQEPEKEVLEVNPLIPRGKISTASWRKGPRAGPTQPSEEESSSLLEGFEADPFGEKAAEKSKRQKGLETIVDQIEGLGIFVAPADEEDEKKN